MFSTTAIPQQPLVRTVTVGNDGKIYSYDRTGQSTPIGVTIEQYNELKAAFEQSENIGQQYYDLLVEKGIIQKELTPAEIAQQQAEQLEEVRKTNAEAVRIMTEMSKQLTALEAEVKAIKGGKENVGKSYPNAVKVAT